jgi:hypothetical protein
MKRAVLALNLALATFAAAPALADGPPTGALPSREAVAEKSALAWLKFVDAGRYAESYAETAELFQRAATQARWVEGLRANRAPLGVASTRAVTSRTYTNQLAGAPGGEYVVLTIATDFAAKKRATETVTVRLERDGHWRVAGYYIR